MTQVDHAAPKSAASVAAAACGSAWYHEEALQDAGLPSKNERLPAPRL